MLTYRSHLTSTALLGLVIVLSLTTSARSATPTLWPIARTTMQAASGRVLPQGALITIPSRLTTGTESLLYNFQDQGDGLFPLGALIADKTGALYGTTIYGGNTSCGCGTVFKLTPSGSGYTERIIYSFAGAPDGAFPISSLIIDKSGALYGMTSQGGTSSNCLISGYPGCGVVFKLTPSGSTYSESILYNFDGGRDGALPNAGLVAGRFGVLFGTTAAGGVLGNCPALSGITGCGTVFRLKKSRSGYTEKILHKFVGAPNDGAIPASSLIVDSAGALYGTTNIGGSGPCASSSSGQGCGTVFKLTPGTKRYTENILYSFQGAPDGAYLLGPVIADSAGVLYGTTDQGGRHICSGYGCGTIFSLTPTGSGYSERVLHSFRGSDGTFPISGVVALGKALYGAAHWGGSGPCMIGGGGTIPGCGTIFKIKPSGSGFTVVYDFQGPPNDGAGLHAGLLPKGGALYGTTQVGGNGPNPPCKHGCGTVYKLTP